MSRLINASDLHRWLYDSNLSFADIKHCIVRNIGFDVEIKDECRDAIRSENNQDGIELDTQPQATLPPSHGPGTELKSLLAGWPFYIVSTPDCKCNARARYMDEKGCDWCESPEGMTEIMGFLREAAEERGLPFVDMAARLLVKRAIHNARKAEAARAREADRPPLRPEQ